MQSLSRGETIQFRIPGDSMYVSMVRRAVQTIALNLGFTDQVVWDIELSVAEALANAVEHGSPDHNGNAVVIVCKFDGEKLTIDVRDEGPGFQLPGNDESSDTYNERGRGLHLIYHLMDKVKVCRTRTGSRIRMVKKKQSPDKAECPA